MKTFGWVVAILIVLYLIGRSLMKNPAQAAVPGTPGGSTAPADTLLAGGQTTAAAIYKLVNDFASQVNGELVDSQPITQMDAAQGDYITMVRPFEEKLAAIPAGAVNQKDIPRAEFKWHPDIMYTNIPDWNKDLVEESNCTCGNGCNICIEV